MTKFHRILFFSIIFFSLFSSCKNYKAQTSFVRAFPKLTFENPIDIQIPGDNSNRLFVVSQSGKIHVFQNEDNTESSSIFLDISNKVLFGGEQGLLGLAFHPNYEENGFFFLNYNMNNPRRTVISRFSVSSIDNNLADLNSELIILEINQPYTNHNGGQITFGPDGFLYISLGDGGSGGDPENRSQNLSSLLGKILRIDVDALENYKNYSIPSDNPFKNNQEGYNEEIYAYGLRNVWKFSFDNLNRLWAADVGQNAWEEINIIENGGNYGWRIMEGFHCFNPSSGCNQEGLKLPVWEYDHSSSGGFSITGGYLFEENNIPDIFNKYVYADFITGNIWAFDPSEGTNSFLLKYSGQISTFGIDENKNLYFADYNSGKLYKLVNGNVNSVRNNLPNKIKLNQNFPNPFNPSTTISYSLSSINGEPNFVQLDVFNVLGEKIVSLVNEYQKSGDYEVQFNSKSLGSASLSSGVYYYRLTTNDIVESKKMILLN